MPFVHFTVTLQGNLLLFCNIVLPECKSTITIIPNKCPGHQDCQVISCSCRCVYLHLINPVVRVEVA